MKYFVYVLKSKVQKRSYVGFTNNLERRIEEHNTGRHLYTKRYLPWKIIYKEECEDFRSARKREKYLKSAAGRRFLKTIFEKFK